MALSKFNLILDLDNTLIASKDFEFSDDSDWVVSYIEMGRIWNESVYKRPGVDEFLDVCFRTFKSVSIWTASVRSRTMVILEEVFPGRAFKDVFTREHCVMTEPDDISSLLKPLWSQGFEPGSTLIIDDNPRVVRDFLCNAWIVPRFMCGDLEDTSLNQIAARIVEFSVTS